MKGPIGAGQETGRAFRLRVIDSTTCGPIGLGSSIKKEEHDVKDRCGICWRRSVSSLDVRRAEFFADPATGYLRAAARQSFSTVDPIASATGAFAEFCAPSTTRKFPRIATQCATDPRDPWIAS